jgi:hypothetical protein
VHDQDVRLEQRQQVAIPEIAVLGDHHPALTVGIWPLILPCNGRYVCNQAAGYQVIYCQSAVADVKARAEGRVSAARAPYCRWVPGRVGVTGYLGLSLASARDLDHFSHTNPQVRRARQDSNPRPAA